MHADRVEPANGKHSNSVFGKHIHHSISVALQSSQDQQPGKMKMMKKKKFAMVAERVPSGSEKGGGTRMLFRSSSRSWPKHQQNEN